MTVSIDIPENLYQQAQDLAESQHLSVDEVISSAFAEHLAAWERLKERAARGQRDTFLRVLDKVPDVEPEEYDRL
jgi:hypothetical protein